MNPRDLNNLKERLHSVGWFMPPYVMAGFLDWVALSIDRGNGHFTQDDLEVLLARVYGPERLAAMVVSRYPEMPVIKLYAETIAESVLAHFSGLKHVAVGGLIPVIEGAGRRLAGERGLDEKGHVKDVFRNLAEFAKQDVIARRIGATDEIVSMLESFVGFIESYFYANSQAYPLDGTNRHGISHGAYTDAEYGRPLNFYKTIAAVDFLTFISSMNTSRMSGFAPNPSPESVALEARYLEALNRRTSN